MKCREIRAITNKSEISQAFSIEIKAHIRTCPSCRDRSLDRAAIAIIKASGASGDSDNHISIRSPSNMILVNRIRSRIQEIREQRASSWEMAMGSMRGWLAAFAAVAVLLIAASIQWQSSPVTSDFDHDGDELTTQNPAEYLISDIPDQVGKDNPYAHK